MRVLIISDLGKFPLQISSSEYWIPLNNTVSGDYWLQLEAQQDLDNAGIEYTIGEVEIKQEDQEI